LKNVWFGLASRILIGIDEEGQIYLENQPIPLEQLQAVLSKVSDVSNDVPVLIKADGMTTLEVMTDVMDACRLNGLSKLCIQSM
jgi:biopolymer transport protein ExbD